MRLKQKLFLSACIVLALVAITSAATALTITSMTPTAAFSDSTVNVMVTGTDFMKNANVWVISPTGAKYQVKVTSRSSTGIEGRLTIPSKADVGTYTLYVKNPGQTAVSKEAAFLVGIKPVITSVSPDTVKSYGIGTGDGYVLGSGFLPDAQVVFTNGETTIEATNEVTKTPGRIDFEILVPPNAACGAYSVSVTNPGFPAVTASAFTKEPAAIRLGFHEGVIDPWQGNRGQTVTVDVYGDGFTQGCQVQLTNGATTISATNEVALWYKITCTLTLPSTAPLGEYIVSVQDPCTGAWIPAPEAHSPDHFEMLDPLTVDSITPASGSRGDTVSAVVRGTNFPIEFVDLRPAAVRLTGGGTTIDGRVGDWCSSQQLYVDFTIPSDAYVGMYTLSVQARGTTTWISKADAFTVT